MRDQTLRKLYSAKHAQQPVEDVFAGLAVKPKGSLSADTESKPLKSM